MTTAPTSAADAVIQNYNAGQNIFRRASIEALINEIEQYQTAIAAKHVLLNRATENLAEIRDLARTGSAPDVLGMTTVAQWNEYKINKIARLAAQALEDR